MILLEVIVSTVADARAAANGGADRLEVVRDIAHGGLTPPLDIVRAIAAATTLPLRVMVRENGAFDTDDGELDALRRAARAFAAERVDGIVVGFARDGEPLLDDVRRVVEAAPHTPVTYHRAFDTLRDPIDAIGRLSTIAQVDRILTDGGTGSHAERCARLRRLSAAAVPITIIAGGNVDAQMLSLIAATGCVREVHVGRAARPGRNRAAAVSADLVRSLRQLADNGSKK
jgi:copper homeostasis protein